MQMRRHRHHPQHPPPEAAVLGEVDAGSLGGKAGTLLGPLTQKIMQSTVYGNDSRKTGTHPQRIIYRNIWDCKRSNMHMSSERRSVGGLGAVLLQD